MRPFELSSNLCLVCLGGGDGNVMILAIIGMTRVFFAWRCLSWDSIQRTSWECVKGLDEFRIIVFSIVFPVFPSPMVSILLPFHPFVWYFRNMECNMMLHVSLDENNCVSMMKNGLPPTITFQSVSIHVLRYSLDSPWSNVVIECIRW